MTRSTSAAADWPGVRPRPSKLAQPPSASASASARILEPDSNAHSAEEAAITARLIEDVDLAHHAVGRHLHVEAYRDAGVAKAPHVPGPDVALHPRDVEGLPRRTEEVAHLLGVRGVRDDLGDVLIGEPLLDRDQPAIGPDARHERRPAVRSEEHTSELQS